MTFARIFYAPRAVTRRARGEKPFSALDAKIPLRQRDRIAFLLAGCGRRDIVSVVMVRRRFGAWRIAAPTGGGEIRREEKISL